MNIKQRGEERRGGRGRVNPPTTLSKTVAVTQDPSDDFLTPNLH